MTYFPWSPKVTLLLHPAAARAGLETVALFESYYFSILKVGISGLLTLDCSSLNSKVS